MKLSDRRGTLKFGLDPVAGPGQFSRVLPFRKSWIAIGILAAMDAVFLVPAITTFKTALGEWATQDSLFDLVAAIFLSAWLLGWMIAPLLLTGILLLMLLGREVLTASPGHVEIRLGIPLVGISTRFDADAMRNLRYAKPVGKSSTSWRGKHAVFDYGGDTVAFGSDISVEAFTELRSRLRTVTGSEMGRAPAPPSKAQPKAQSDTRQETIRKTAPGIDSPATAVARPSVRLTSASSQVLIFANLLPVAGSLFFGWKLSDIMVLYWAESAVIGFFNVCKIFVINRAAALLAGPFFIGHFGGFMAIHFLFLYTIFVKPDQPGTAAGNDLSQVAELFTVLWPALLALFISHAFSFYHNFLGRKEYLGRTVNQQMSEPYSRIVFMHLALIFGGGLSMALGGPSIVLLIIIAFKIVFDVRAHLKQHGAEEKEKGKGKRIRDKRT